MDVGLIEINSVSTLPICTVEEKNNSFQRIPVSTY